MTVLIPTLETERLLLRPPSISCADVYEEFYTDPVASQHYGGPLTAGATCFGSRR
jgi:[ribosomal protein S5]-alanine N-acetyltransferase